VLRILKHTDIVSRDARLAYMARCMARPAFESALQAQLRDFKSAA
jgi:hypothetical protein